MSDNKRGPGRPKANRTDAGMSQAMAETNPGVETGSREENAHGVTRHNRISLGGASKTLGISPHLLDKLKKEGKHPHFVRDDSKGRLQQTKDAGYEHVIDDQGNNVYRNSGQYKLYLMVLPQEWHEDDMKLKKQRVAASLGEADDEQSSIALDGSVKSKASDNMYTS